MAASICVMIERCAEPWLESCAEKGNDEYILIWWCVCVWGEREWSCVRLSILSSLFFPIYALLGGGYNSVFKSGEKAGRA